MSKRPGSGVQRFGPRLAMIFAAGLVLCSVPAVAQVGSPADQEQARIRAERQAAERRARGLNFIVRALQAKFIEPGLVTTRAVTQQWLYSLCQRGWTVSCN